MPGFVPTSVGWCLPSDGCWSSRPFPVLILPGPTAFHQVPAMPIYAYKCESCGHAKDVLQKMSDDPLTVCPACGQPSFRKQLTAAGFQLKGSGWYVTDFREGSKPAATPAAEGTAPAVAAPAAKGAGDSATASSTSQAAAAPAAAPAPAAKAPASASPGTSST